ncbi:MAG: FtsQ-type POTRA domain-containing protein [Acidimicrobiaceae bacterium]|nr:FtsQ-type POTRA domain-containing protein [Acidimicrobiaceae bacterium]MXW61558.1 FtsQ-type POTRA domain-containing protein [Acidimicrobiaceae bacterium]MXW75522.1 FtsQ-type POTRA domain-containing protein [Acidimicrobiaceae bacterium]MYA73953.1 FtsQ-type POTRA domain-containing protein [Acidimicrobiaceae bacterium]MYC42202.1 FtsQ-type POTRA domain-containing protein [Acidimicrobiaceae bacterium]
MTTVTDIDPRLRARRGAVRRAEGRRRLRFILIGLAILGLIFCGWAALRSPLLDLDHVEITGLGPSRLAEAQQSIGLEKGTPLNDIEIGPIKADLEALPWVLRADVEKSWPSTVHIEVVERIAVAQLAKEDGRVAVVDATGTIMAEGGLEYEELPRISLEASAALGEVEPQSRPGLALIATLPDDLLQWIEAVTYSPGASPEARGVVGLDLVGQAEAHLGEATLLSDKVQALRTVLNGVDLTCIRVIDVAVPDFPTIRRDPVCSAWAQIN